MGGPRQARRHRREGPRLLARYVFRIAITNSRLERFEDGRVTFRYRDNRSGQITRCTVSASEFIERFLQHVLPRGFTKVRYYGLYAPSRHADLDHVRALRPAPPRMQAPAPTAPSAPLPAEAPLAIPSAERCPVCRVGRLRIVETFPRSRNREPP